jgi:putative glutamine amidotransferase
MKKSAQELVIGISGTERTSKSVCAMMSVVEKAKAKPLFLGEHGSRSAKTDIEKIDAVIFMGNDFDIDPSSYIERYPQGHKKRKIHPATKSESSTPTGKARALYEEEMIRLALKKKLPMLGICGGMQRINIICGGTLHQHVPDLVGHDKLQQSAHGIDPCIPVRPVVISPGTRLSMIARDIKMSFVSSDYDCPTVIMENSLRHQSIDIVGKGLRVCSLSDTVRRIDGTTGYLIEAIEADPKGAYGDQFLLGVQWHPEFGASMIGEHIIRHLIEAARKEHSEK